jgi:photosystem II stability/assembly factor-like uncharacterized protein
MRIDKFTFLLIILFFFSTSYSQILYEWTTLANAPETNRFNDLYFVNPETGWIVNGDGEIYKTTDGGESWQLQFESSASHFRSVGFFNLQHGYAGNVGYGEFGTTDSSALYETTDGGITWNPMDNFVGPNPTGLCGMFVVNDSVIYSVGRVRGPACIIKTTDGGNTWYSKNMGSYAAGLIDCYFFTKDSGYVVGLTNSNHNESRGIILFTSDAGATWETKYTTSEQGQWCWKITFPSKQVGYASIQRNNGSPVNIIKTTDGGNSWFEMTFSSSPYFVQGIGFANDTLGWIGGNSTLPSYQTTNGGETWNPYPIGIRLNRFRMINDTLGYAAGATVHKYISHKTTGFESELNLATKDFHLYQNYPNPFNPVTNMSFVISYSSFVSLKVYDVLGNETALLLNEEKQPGYYQLTFDAGSLPSGIYFYKLLVGNNFVTKKMLLIK